MYILIGLVVLLLISTIFHQIMIKVETERYKQPGKLIEVDGHKMHITGNGTGRPTVIMTTGSGSACAYTDYYLMNSKISEITRTCIYERPGIGWSEHASTPRNTEQLVSDLHTLLEKAGEKPPYILVGYSLGAMEMLLYSHNYPDEVAAIVLIDGASPYYFIHNQWVSICNNCIAYCMRFLNFTGITRILMELKLLHVINHRIRHLPKDMGKLDKAMIYKNACNSMMVRELDSIVTTSLKMNEELDLKNVPMVVYTIKESFKRMPTWEETQKSLLKFSSNSRQIILENTTHPVVLHDCWEQISDGIKELIVNEKVKHS